MPPKTKIKKDDIVQKALEITEKYGFESVNARTIAKELNCSVQPIFSNFKSMDELKGTITMKTLDIYMKYLSYNTSLDREDSYKQLGINYIRFAKEQPNLFKLMFMNKTDLSAENFMIDNPAYDNIKLFVSRSTKLDDDKIKSFHVKMWFFTHGIASLIANNTCSFTDSQINQLLVDEYIALMELEKIKNKERGNYDEENK